MQGRITKFRSDMGVGVIEADCGRKFRFTKSEIRSAGSDLVGQDVDFLVEAQRPREIIMLGGSPWAAFSGCNA